MATKLALFNGALRLCKERRLAALTDNIEARHLLDDAYGDGSTNGSVRRCLELGQWTFAMRAQEITYSPSVEPDFGYRRGFDQPTDMVAVSAICSDEYFKSPLLEYADERNYWFADLDTIYVRFVSNHATYGADLSLWPQTFADLVEADLASQIVGNLTGADISAVSVVYKERLSVARSKDAMRKPTAFMPSGSWAGARRGGQPRMRYSLP